jgi:dolichol-phosphate mannosyltransferase
MDADLEHPADYVRKVLEMLESGRCAYVMAERELQTRSLVFKVGNYLLTLVFNILWLKKFDDVLTGLIGFYTHSIGGTKIESKRFCLEVELLSRVLSRGIKPCRIKFRQRPRQAGSKKLQIYHGLEILWCIIKYRLKALKPIARARLAPKRSKAVKR